MNANSESKTTLGSSVHPIWRVLIAGGLVVIALVCLGAYVPGINVNNNGQLVGNGYGLTNLQRVIPVFNITDFGAVGDGVTDCRTNIQAALDTAYAAGGGVVYVPKGSFAFSENASNGGVTINDNVSLVGGGWGSELLFTENGAAIAALGSSGNQAAQDAGNTNISVRNLKLRYTTAVYATGIGVSMAGVSGGQVQNVWVDNCGGYSIYLGKNNGTTTTHGKVCNNIQVANCRITGMMDVGVELYGAINCQVENVSISGPGGPGGQGILLWGGANHCQVANINIEAIGVSNNLTAVQFSPQDGTNVLFPATSDNIVSGVIARNIMQAIGVAGSGSRKVFSATVLDSTFYGQLTNTLNYPAVIIDVAESVEISSCVFSNFAGIGFRAGETLTNLVVRNCQFDTVANLYIYGLRGLTFCGNRIMNVSSAVGLILAGVQEGMISDNHFSNVGISGDSSAMSLSAFGGRECLNLNITGNKSDDNRATKYLLQTVSLEGGSDYIVASGNNSAGGKAGGVDIKNVSTGTHNSLMSSSQTGGFSFTGGNVGIGTATPTSGRLVIDGGHLTFGTDNTYDIGASDANRPRNFYAGGFGNFGSGILGSYLFLTGGGYFAVSSDGVLKLQNVALSSFDRLQFGGSTATFPAWKRNAAGFDLVGANGTYNSSNNLIIPGSLNVTNTLYARTNVAPMDVTTTDFVLNTRYTNANRRALLAASFSLNAAAAGTAQVSLVIEHGTTITNKLTVNAGPLASLQTTEALSLMASPGAFYYFTNETSGAGGTATVVAGTCSVTGL